MILDLNCNVLRSPACADCFFQFLLPRLLKCDLFLDFHDPDRIRRTCFLDLFFLLLDERVVSSSASAEIRKLIPASFDLLIFTIILMITSRSSIYQTV